MAMDFDASTKHLIEELLPDWVPLSGRRVTGRIEVRDADVSAVTAAADKVAYVHDAEPWIFHLEVFSGRDGTAVPRTHLYNALLEYRHGVPVCSVVVLLRRAADSPDFTGETTRNLPGEPSYRTFRYRVVRVWELPAVTFLTGGLGTLPLAPLSAVREEELAGVVGQMEERIRREAPPGEAGELWTATKILMGLRYSRDLVARLLRGVHGMRESVTYQEIVEEGEIRALQDVVLRLGRARLGPTGAETEAIVRNITDLDRLRLLTDRLLQASSWQELLGP